MIQDFNQLNENFSKRINEMKASEFSKDKTESLEAEEIFDNYKRRLKDQPSRDHVEESDEEANGK